MSRPRLPDPVVVDESAPVPPAHRPTWWNVNTVRWVAFAAIWIALALSLLAVLANYRQAQTAQAVATATNRRLTVLEQYVNGKGVQRDRENAALNARITQAICDLLDQLPASAVLDKPRGKYGCGPGLPAATTPSSAPGAVDRAAPRQPPATTTATSAATSTTPPAPAQPPPGAPASPSPPAAGATPPGALCTVIRLLCPNP